MGDLVSRVSVCWDFWASHWPTVSDQSDQSEAQEVSGSFVRMEEAADPTSQVEFGAATLGTNF